MTRTVYRKVLDQRLIDAARQLAKLERRLKAASGVDRLRCFQAILALEQESADMRARLGALERGGAERRRDALRFEIERMTDDLAHGMARWIARLDAHFVVR